MNPILYFLLLIIPALSQASIVLEDDGEHGTCYGLKTSSAGKITIPFRSTCKADNSGNISLSSEAARTGHLGYKLPISISDASPQQLIQGTGIHSAKMTANSGALSQIQKPNNRLRYTAFFFIESGFDDTAWHIQMQWKAYQLGTNGVREFWPAQNPKIAWGFRRLDKPGKTNLPLQIVATVREAYPNDCKVFSYDLLTRESTLSLPPIPVPKQEWVKVTTEIYFHKTNGYIRIWQGANNGQMVINAQNINTVSQLVPRDAAKPSDSPCDRTKSNTYSYTNPTHFNFGIANYMSGRSFYPKYRGNQDSHILYIDDIVISTVNAQSDNAPEPPILSVPLQP